MLPARVMTGQMRQETDYVSAYLHVSVASEPGDIAAARSGFGAWVHSLAWPERSLRWLDATTWTDAADCGCGFDSADAYPDTESQQELPPWVWLPADESVGSPVGLIVSCKMNSLEIEPVASLAAALLEWFGAAVAAASDGHAALVRSAKVVLVSRCPRLPILSLPNGLRDLTLSDGAHADEAVAMLQWAGMFAIRRAVGDADVRALALLVRRRVTALEAKLVAEGHAEGLGGGDFSYAEVCSRGRNRWDMLLHAPPQDGVPELVLGASAGVETDDVPLLERVARGGRWSPAVAAALGEDFEWQVSLICSRPEAPAGHWHSDGGHSRFTYGENAEGAPLAYALCAFVPLVPLAAPRRVKAEAETETQPGGGLAGASALNGAPAVNSPADRASVVIGSSAVNGAPAVNSPAVRPSTVNGSSAVNGLPSVAGAPAVNSPAVGPSAVNGASAVNSPAGGASAVEGASDVNSLVAGASAVNGGGPGRGAMVHGSGCTAFWPGSHCQPACLQLGAAASTRLRAVIAGAPMEAGDALLYDYRTVHCGSPNQGAERPILQFTFSRKGYRDRFRNYGFHQLFYDDD